MKTCHKILFAFLLLGVVAGVAIEAHAYSRVKQAPHGFRCGACCFRGSDRSDVSDWSDWSDGSDVSDRSDRSDRSDGPDSLWMGVFAAVFGKSVFFRAGKLGKSVFFL